MLSDVAKRYSFLDRNGNRLDLDRKTAVDQYGKSYDYGYNDLTSVVIISAERGSDTGRCVESIFQNTREPFEIILSDVGSGVETLEIITALEDAHENVHAIYNKQGTGTTGQRNQGIFFSRGEYVVVMDNDVLVLPGWLKPLKETAARQEQIGMVGGKLLRAEIDQVYYCGCHTVTLEKAGRVYGVGLAKSGYKANLQRYDPLAMRGGEVPWYTTTALLTKRKAVFEVGGFDDVVEGKGIFIANEDKDLSLNMRKAGYKIYYCPESETIHNHDYSKVDKTDSYHAKYRLRMEQIAKDTEYFLKKWDIIYMIEKLPGGDYSKKWDGNNLIPLELDLESDAFRDDIVVLK